MPVLWQSSDWEFRDRMLELGLAERISCEWKVGKDVRGRGKVSTGVSMVATSTW